MVPELRRDLAMSILVIKMQMIRIPAIVRAASHICRCGDDGLVARAVSPIDELPQPSLGSLLTVDSRFLFPTKGRMWMRPLMTQRRNRPGIEEQPKTLTGPNNLSPQKRINNADCEHSERICPTIMTYAYMCPWLERFTGLGRSHSDMDRIPAGITINQLAQQFQRISH